MEEVSYAELVEGRECTELPKPPRLIAVTGRARDDAPDPNIFAQYLVKPVLSDALVEAVMTEANAARQSSPSSA